MRNHRAVTVLVLVLAASLLVGGLAVAQIGGTTYTGCLNTATSGWQAAYAGQLRYIAEGETPLYPCPAGWEEISFGPGALDDDVAALDGRLTALETPPPCAGLVGSYLVHNDVGPWAGAMTFFPDGLLGMIDSGQFVTDSTAGQGAWRCTGETTFSARIVNLTGSTTLAADMTGSFDAAAGTIAGTIYRVCENPLTDPLDSCSWITEGISWGFAGAVIEAP